MIRRVPAFLTLFAIVGTVPVQAQWVKTNGPDSVRAIVVGWVAPSYVVFAGTSSGVYRSLDSGMVWTQVNSGLTNISVRALLPASAGTLFAGTDSGVFRSTNSGASWESFSNGLTVGHIQALVISGSTYSTLYAGTISGVFRTEISSASWSKIDSGLMNLNVRALTSGLVATSPAAEGVLAGTQGGGVFRLKSGAGSWEAVNAGLPNLDITSIVYAPSGGLFYAGTNGAGVFSSSYFGSPEGLAWSAVTGSAPKKIRSISIGPGFDDRILAGSDSGVLITPLHGGSIARMDNQGITDSNIRVVSSATRIPYFYAGTDHGIWRHYDPKPEVDGISPKGRELRMKNTANSISFSLPSASRVIIEAVSLSGKKFGLLNTVLPAGSHTRLLSTEALPAGLYFFRLQVGDQTETRKVVLTR